MATTGSGTSTPSVAPVGFRTLGQIITTTRKRLDDTVEPYMWSNDELTDIVDYLQYELAGEMLLIEDATSDLCSVDLVEGDGYITLDPRIIKITRAKLASQTRLLSLETVDSMDRFHSNWDSGTVAEDTPQYIITEGLGERRAYLHPPLDEATDTLNLTVRRLPLDTLSYDENSGDPLEIDRYSHLLLNGILWKAYSKGDNDTNDPKRAEQFRIYWEGQDGRGGDKERIRRLAKTIRHQHGPETAGPVYAML